MVAEYAFYKGKLSSRLLFGLVIRLYKLSMTGNIILHVIWLSGTIMISCGIDGLSRGTLSHRGDGWWLEKINGVHPIILGTGGKISGTTQLDPKLVASGGKRTPENVDI